MAKASIAIFKKSIETESVSKPICPDDVFLAANRVLQSKSIELVKCPEGMFVVSYSATGPFSEHLSDEWLPVYVARIETWSSGGIKKQEIQKWAESNEQSK